MELIVTSEAIGCGGKGDTNLDLNVSEYDLEVSKPTRPGSDTSYYGAEGSSRPCGTSCHLYGMNKASYGIYFGPKGKSHRAEDRSTIS